MGISKNYKLLIFTTLLFLYLQLISYSQTNNNNDFSSVNDSLLIGRAKAGISYSGISSFGFTFQNQILDLFRYSVTGFLASDRILSKSVFDINLGLQLQKPFVGDNNNYAYVFAGGGISNFTISELIIDDDESPTNERMHSFGIGIGASVKVYEKFAIDLEFGFGFCKTYNELYDSNPITSPQIYLPKRRVGTTFGVGIYRTF